MGWLLLFTHRWRLPAKTSVRQYTSLASFSLHWTLCAWWYYFLVPGPIFRQLLTPWPPETSTSISLQLAPTFTMPTGSFVHNKPTSRHLWSITRRMTRSEEHTSELQSRFDLVCRLLLEKKKDIFHSYDTT